MRCTARDQVGVQLHLERRRRELDAVSRDGRVGAQAVCRGLDALRVQDARPLTPQRGVCREEVQDHARVLNPRHLLLRREAAKARQVLRRGVQQSRTSQTGRLLGHVCHRDGRAQRNVRRREVRRGRVH